MRRVDRLTLATALAAAAAIAAAAACGDSTPVLPPPNTCSEENAASTGIVQLYDWGFIPSCLEVGAGVEVTFLNAGANPDRVVSAVGEAESFDSGIIISGGAIRHPFATAGVLLLQSAYYAKPLATVIVLP
jgi:hypothetical protein